MMADKRLNTELATMGCFISPYVRKHLIRLGIQCLRDQPCLKSDWSAKKMQ